jgi:hypothetical protein
MKKIIDENKLDLSQEEFRPWNEALETFNKCIKLENNKKCLPVELQNLLDETKALNESFKNK